MRYWLGFVAITASVAVCAMAQRTRTEHCSELDTTKPDAIRGGERGSDGTALEHVSDVNADKNTYRFFRAIRNRHPNNVLDASWEKADIPPNAIDPMDCASSTLTVGKTKGYTEDEKAELHYGASLQHSKQASTYVVGTSEGAAVNGGAGRAAVPNDGSPLRSTLYCKVRSRNDRVVLDVTFTTEVAAGKFRYTVQNQGSGQLRFKAPNLTDAVSTYVKASNALREAQWEGDAEKGFLVEAGQRPAALVVNRVGDVRVEERVVSLQLLAIDGTLLAKMSVSAYLPVVE